MNKSRSFIPPPSRPDLGSYLQPERDPGQVAEHEPSCADSIGVRMEPFSEILQNGAEDGKGKVMECFSSEQLLEKGDVSHP